MNVDNWNTWLTALRTGTYTQGTGALAEIIDGDTYGYCCLGVGCTLVPDLDTEVGLEHVMFGPYLKDTLAPYEFIEWLGLEDKINKNADSLLPDTRLMDSYDLRLDTVEYTDLWAQNDSGGASGDPSPFESMTCASMNDDLLLTFPQIADMLAYFGVSRVV